eukprot:scaffold97061_cov54-Phaeocystis_antarctica.AAC.2
MPRLASFLWATGFACLLSCAEANIVGDVLVVLLGSVTSCSIIDVPAGYGTFSANEGYEFSDDCGVLTSGCNEIGYRAFKDTNARTLTVKYDASPIVIGQRAFLKVPADFNVPLTVRMQCKGGCTTSSLCTATSGGLSCPCTIRP